MGGLRSPRTSGPQSPGGEHSALPEPLPQRAAQLINFTKEADLIRRRFVNSVVATFVSGAMDPGLPAAELAAATSLPGAASAGALSAGDAPPSAKARKRRSKKQAKKAEDAEADAMDEIDAALGRITVAQEQIKGLYDTYHKLQAQLDVLSSRTANTPRGHAMLYDRKKSLMDQMEGLLNEIKRLEEEAPGAGNVRDAKELEARFSAAVLSGEANGAAAVERLMGEMAERSEARRQAATELAKSLRAGGALCT